MCNAMKEPFRRPRRNTIVILIAFQDRVKHEVFICIYRWPNIYYLLMTFAINSESKDIFRKINGLVFPAIIKYRLCRDKRCSNNAKKKLNDKRDFQNIFSVMTRTMQEHSLLSCQKTADGRQSRCFVMLMLLIYVPRE